MNEIPTGRALRIGVASLVERPIKDLAARATELEGLGYDQIWVPDERLLRNVYVALAAIATATERIGIATGVTNPYTRHPAMTAAAIATIDEPLRWSRQPRPRRRRWPRRVRHQPGQPGCGRCAKPPRSMRTLTGGGRIDATDAMFAMAAGLNFTPIRPVPVYLAARGPRILKLAGEIADEVVIGGFARPSGIGYARAQVAAWTRTGGPLMG